MDDILDLVWDKIVAGIQVAARVMDHLVEPLDILGPAAAVFVIALMTVGATKLFSRMYTTRRYRELKNEFQHWYAVRQEALKCEDREKGKALAKNIDQAKLNRVYYDYFFEGFLSNILTVYLPVLTMAAYVNEAFRPEALMARFGQTHVFFYSGIFGGDPMTVGAVLWFVLSLLVVYVGWAVAARVVRKTSKPLSDPLPEPAPCRI